MKLVYRYLGYLMLMSAVFRLPPAIVAFYKSEPMLFFWLSMALTLVIGGLLVYFFRYSEEKEELISLKHGIILSAVSFVIIPLFGSITYLPTMDYSLINAYFESVSGFTTTGLTLYNDLDSLPKSLLLWRATTQWLGGIGIITIFLFIFSRLHQHDYASLKEIQSEAQKTVKLLRSQGMAESPEGSLGTSMKSILVIYLAYTLLGVILLKVVGLSLFESVSLAFTSLSTGGFSVTNEFYESGAVLLVLELMMLLGAISFISHNKLLLGKIKEFLNSFEKNLMLGAILVATGLAWLVFPDLKSVFFQVVSAFTTTGYSAADIHLLPELVILIIMSGMLVGGTFGSTAGGMKLYRVYYLFKTIPWSIRKLISPTRAIIPLKVENKTVDEAKLINIGVFVFTYLFILFIGTLLFMVFGHTFLNSAFQMFSALGTVGLQTMDLMTLNAFLKSILIIAMLFGRLEIFPVLILFREILVRYRKNSL